MLTNVYRFTFSRQYYIWKHLCHGSILDGKNDENIKKRNFSKIISAISGNKEVFEGANENIIKLDILPVLSIIFVLILFSYSLEDIELINKSIKNISEIFEQSKVSTILKSFNISILLRIVKKLSSKKIDVSIYIVLINNLIKSIIKFII